MRRSPGSATARPLSPGSPASSRPSPLPASGSRYHLALRPLPIAGQRRQAQPLPSAELNTAQPAGFVLAHHLLGFRTTPPAPDFHYRCLFVHPPTASPSAAREQMGWSNAYDLRVILSARRPDTDEECVPFQTPIAVAKSPSHHQTQVPIWEMWLARADLRHLSAGNAEFELPGLRKRRFEN